MQKIPKQLTDPKLLRRVKRLEDGNNRYIKILKKISQKILT